MHTCVQSQRKYIYRELTVLWNKCGINESKILVNIFFIYDILSLIKNIKLVKRIL